MNKRGIAPLIATILLIVLAVGLGVLVMNFGRAQIEETARCSVNIGLKFVELNTQKQVCLDKNQNQIYFIVENGNNIEINSMNLRVIGSEEILVTDINNKIEKLGTLMKYIDYENERYGSIKQLKLTPKVSLYGQEEYCDEQSITVENVRECTT
ncbi:hypothetical protein KY306_00480 [Candidatus Woesearchaeota archaeon]|nr:hypothetical protein [Candidatus Woesearchaeota archaeon]